MTAHAKQDVRRRHKSRPRRRRPSSRRVQNNPNNAQPTTTKRTAARGRAVDFMCVLNAGSVSTTVVIQQTDGTTTGALWSGTLGAGESVTYTQMAGFQKLTSGGLPIAATAAGAVDVQSFSATGTWTKPTGFTPKMVLVRMWGAGGGGGAGASLATAVVAKGGGSGGGGAYVERWMAAADLAATIAITIGAGGLAGAPGAAGTLGGDGGIGGSTTFGTLDTEYGGGGGRGGEVTAVVTGGGRGGAAGGAGGVGTT